MTQRTLWISLGVLATLGVLSSITRQNVSAPEGSDVLVIRDTDEIRFTNDSAIALHNCSVDIDGDFSAMLNELPARGRATLPRHDFSGTLPRDEFYRRSRTMAMRCYNDANALVPITLK